MCNDKQTAHVNLDGSNVIVCFIPLNSVVNMLLANSLCYICISCKNEYLDIAYVIFKVTNKQSQ